MDNKKPLYKKLYFWILLLFFIYTLVGFFVVPRIIKSTIEEISLSQLNSTVEIDKVQFNPYVFSVNISHIQLFAQDKKRWFSADRIYTNINLFKTIFNNISLSELSLEQPNYYFQLEQEADATIIKYPKITQSSANTDETTALELDVNRIAINQGSITYFDKSTATEVELNLKQIAFNQIDFTTKDKNSNFQLNFITEHEDIAEIKGELNLSQLKANGEWKLSQFSTKTIFKFISDANQSVQGFQNKSGSITASGSFEFDSSVHRLPNIIINSLQLSNFESLNNDPKQPTILIPELKLEQAEIDLNQQLIQIDTLTTENLKAQVYFDKNNQLLFNPNTAMTSDTAESSSEDEIKDWSLMLKQINNNASQVVVNKVRNGEDYKSTIRIINNSIKNLTNIHGQIIEINTNLIADEQGMVNIGAQIQNQPFKLSSNLAIDKISLTSLQAWIPEQIQIQIESGQLSVQQQFELSNSDFSSQGSVSLFNLNLLDKNNQTLLKLEQLELLENKIDSKLKTIDLNKIKVTKAEGNLSVSEQSELNVSSILAESTDDEATETEINDTKNDWIINIKDVEMLDLQTNFTDRSIKPNYHSELTKLNGTIKDLSSANTSKANVNIEAILDTYAKVSIKGEINPLSEKAYTDLNINIENIDLQNFTSYSSEHIGFPIQRGKADLKFKYKLNQSLLEGINDLEFKQLELGEKLQNNNAINLPLKLAMALLTDSNGIMSIYLPVSGRIDDPEFSYGGLVFKAFFKLITGIVASPFKLLGKLIPGGEQLDMSSVNFIDGSDELKADETDKLKAMQQILEKRPNLILELTGVVNSIEDKKVIQQSLLLKQMKLNSMPDLSDEDLQAKIKKFYIQIFSEQKWLELTQQSTIDSVINTAILFENSWNQMLQSFNNKATMELDLLAQRRAQKIQQLLINEYKIPESSIFLKNSEIHQQLIPQVKFGVSN